MMTLQHLNDNAMDDGAVPSNLRSRIIEKKEYELRGVGSWWQCILTNCHYIAPDFPSLSEHLRSIHPAEKTLTLRCEICSKLCKAHIQRIARGNRLNKSKSTC